MYNVYLLRTVFRLNRVVKIFGIIQDDKKSSSICYKKFHKKLYSFWKKFWLIKKRKATKRIVSLWRVERDAEIIVFILKYHNIFELKIKYHHDFNKI